MKAKVKSEKSILDVKKGGKTTPLKKAKVKIYSGQLLHSEREWLCEKGRENKTRKLKVKVQTRL